MRILIVDDQPSTLQILQQMLTDYWPESEILRARNGEMALNITEVSLPDLMLTDWQMPGLSGVDLVRILHKNHPELPIILYSGLRIEPEDLELALEAGATDFLRKPLEKTEVIARTKSALRMTRMLKQLKKDHQSKNMIFSMLASHLIQDASQTSMALKLMKTHSQQRNFDFFDKILDQAQQVCLQQQNLLDHLLAWSQLRFEERQLYFQSFKLRQFITSWIAPFRAQHPDLSLRINPALSVYTDPQILSEILNELLTNAIQACPEQKIVIKTASSTEGVWIEVLDQGPGLPEPLLQSVSKPFYSPENWQERSPQRGLGLKICHELLALMGTQLHLESTPQKGTRARFQVPTVEISKL